MNDTRLTGVQVWARELSDGSRLVGLLNAQDTAGLDPSCSWVQTLGGYSQVSGSGRRVGGWA